MKNSIAGLKAQAKALRAALAASGRDVSHSQSLELLARQHGVRDWNTLHAMAGNAPPGFVLGQRVAGRYLGQHFRGKILAIRSMADDTRLAVTIRFDCPVDVIRFEGMSNLRSQVNAVIDLDGCTVEKTSDGLPQLMIEPERAS